MIIEKKHYSLLEWRNILLKYGLRLGNFSTPHSLSIKGTLPISLNNIFLSGNVKIGRYTSCRGGLLAGEIGSFCSVAPNVVIGAGQHPTSWLSTSAFQYHKNKFSFYDEAQAIKIQQWKGNGLAPTIGNDVWIGHSAHILRGVTIGDGAIIGANAVVTKDIPPYAIAVGVPAKVIKYRFPLKIIKRLLAIQWWDLDMKILSKVDYSDINSALEYLEGLNTIKKAIPKEFILKRESFELL